MKSSDETIGIEEDFANLARLAVNASTEDVRLLLAKLVRKYRARSPKFAEELQTYLKTSQTRAADSSILRKGPVASPQSSDMPIDMDTRMSLIRVFNDLNGIERPILEPALTRELAAIVKERTERDRLERLGITPSRSAVLIGPPGVGKTLSARWLASNLGKPLWVLDLTTVMSSLLGKTGSNLRAVFDHAKANEAVLLLDEIDAIAKRRSDESDVGELKRLVAGILQEVDAWPSSGLLLAATNHPELVDPALWRRFDVVLEFGAPTRALVEDGIRRFLGTQQAEFEGVIDLLTKAFEGSSLSDVERAVNSLRRQAALNGDVGQSAVDLILPHVEKLDKQARVVLATELAKAHKLSHNRINEITGVSRDTIRKYAGKSHLKGRSGRKEE